MKQLIAESLTAGIKWEDLLLSFEWHCMYDGLLARDDLSEDQRTELICVADDY